MIYRYLMENGYEHAGYSFYNEAHIEKQQIEPSTVPCGLLLHVTQKALQQIDIETHLDQNGYLHECNQPLTLLGSHSCISTQSYNAIVQQNKVKIQQINVNDKSIYNTIDPESLPQPIIIQPQEAIKLTKQKQNNIEELKAKIEESRKQENQMIEFIQSLEKQQQDQLSQETQDFCINQVKNVLKALKKQKIDLDEKYLQNVELNEQQSVQQQSEATTIQDVISSPQKSKLVVIYKQFDSQPIQIIEIDNKQLDQNNTSNQHFTLVLSKNKLKCITYDDHQLQVSRDLLVSSLSQEFVDMFWDSKLKQLIVVQNDANISILELSLKQDHLTIKLKGRKYYCGMLLVQKLFYNKELNVLILIGQRDIQLFSIESQQQLKIFLSGLDAQTIKQSYLGQPNYEIMQTLSELLDDQIELSENQQNIIFSTVHNNSLYIQLENNKLLQFNIFQKYYQPKSIIQLDEQIQMYLFYNDKNYLLLNNHKIYILEDSKTTLLQSEFQPIFIATINNSMLIFTDDQKLLTYDKYNTQCKQLKQDFDLKQVCNANDQILNVILSKDELLFLVKHIKEDDKAENELVCVNLNNETECKVDQRFGNYQIEKLLSDKYVLLKNRCICIRLQAGLRE